MGRYSEVLFHPYTVNCALFGSTVFIYMNGFSRSIDHRFLGQFLKWIGSKTLGILVLQGILIDISDHLLHGIETINVYFAIPGITVFVVIMSAALVDANNKLKKILSNLFIKVIWG